MGASESKTDGIDVDVDVADAPVDKTPTPTGSTLSEVDDAKPATPQAVYRTADAPEAGALDKYGTADGAEEKTTPPAGKTPAQFPPVGRGPGRAVLPGGASSVSARHRRSGCALISRPHRHRGATAQVKAGAELAALDRIKDNLGHPRPPRTDSTLYADKVGKEFASKQPEHEVTAADASQFAAQGVAPGVGPVYH